MVHSGQLGPIVSEWRLSLPATSHGPSCLPCWCSKPLELLLVECDA
jgi:hypothetical protein